MRYCPECGFQQSEAHNYCERCGTLLHVEGAATGETTGPFTLGNDDADGLRSGAHTIDGPALAIRAGGGISGEVFRLTAGEVTIGRDSTCDVFLDDVTVSRKHATLQVGAEVVLQDLGSLNGTYVNRRRIDSEERLVDGDELQIGKFRLAFIA
jgi:pSer/pThr/pTyr-binding forkhead associated (FHA) protein